MASLFLLLLEMEQEGGPGSENMEGPGDLSLRALLAHLQRGPGVSLSRAGSLGERVSLEVSLEAGTVLRMFCLPHDVLLGLVRKQRGQGIDCGHTAGANRRTCRHL